jgi:hypothetical protein
MHLVLEFLFEPLKTFAVFRHRPDVFLEDDWLRGRGTDDLTEPSQVSWDPGRLARIADIVAQEKGFETMLGRLKIAQRIFPGTAQVADSFVLDLGDIDRREISRAPQAGQLDSGTPVRFDPIACLLGAERGGHNPADVAFLGEIAVEPIPTRPCFIDKDQMFAFGPHFPDELVDIALARTEGTEVDGLSMVFLGDIGDCNRVFMDIHTDVERARLVHG